MTLKRKTARTVQDFPRLATKKKAFWVGAGVCPHLLCVRMCLRIRVNLSEIPAELREKTVTERAKKEKNTKKTHPSVCRLIRQAA